LTTLFAENNRQSGNMFDVVTSSNALSVTGFDLNLFDGTYTIEVYEKAGTWVGFNNTPGAWTLVESVANVTSAGVDNPTHIDVSGLTLDANATTGLYLTGTEAGTSIFAYTNGTAVGNVAASNSDLSILEGAGVSYAFDTTFTPRIWNGTIYYTAASVPEPSTLILAGIAGLLGLGFAWRRGGLLPVFWSTS
jgi:PEP-CTERM motif